jgi:hypothetical protein
MPETRDDDADRGTRLHSAWEKDDPSGLDTEDTEIYERGVKIADQTVLQWRAFLESKGQMSPAIKEGPREERFWFHDKGGNLAASGQADRHYLSPPYGLVIDFKSLWCKSLAAAEWNWQARLLVVLAAGEFDLSHVRFAFLKAMFGVRDVVDYGTDDIARARWGVDQVLWEQVNNGQRRAGPHCRHCNAVTACPEAAAYVTLPTSIVKAKDGVTPKIARELVAQLSLLDCVKIWEGETSRHNIENACKARLKMQPESRLKEMGLKFGAPSINRPITDPARALHFLSTMIPWEKLWAAVNIGNGDLAEIVQAAGIVSSKKAAESWIREKLKPFITEKEQQKPLERI